MGRCAWWAVHKSARKKNCPERAPERCCLQQRQGLVHPGNFRGGGSTIFKIFEKKTARAKVLSPPRQFLGAQDWCGCPWRRQHRAGVLSAQLYRQAPAAGPNLLCLFEGKVPDVADRVPAQKSGPLALARMWGKKIPRADNGSFSKYHQLFGAEPRSHVFRALR